MTPAGAIMIAGVSSGVGKTSLTLGIVRAAARRGLRVQTFKVGPDFLDPTYLALASGRPCYNLDGWMTGRDYVRQLFARAAANADLAVIEGVMGLFDGASPTDLAGSSAEVAIWLDVPVLLVANAHGQARSLAATVKGFAEFEPALRLAGVIANQSGSQRHRRWLSESLAAAHLPPLIGAVPRGALPTLASRHLGLTSADGHTLPQEMIDQLADACEKHLAMDAILGAMLPRPFAEACSPKPRGTMAPGAHTSLVGNCAAPRAAACIAVARDEAFHFYYPDNLEILRDLGAEIVEFSPLRDRGLPPGVGGVYLGGGYPEVHAARLAANEPMLADIRRHVAESKALYAECGGLMYLGRTLTDLDGRRHSMAGVLPIDTLMLGKLKSLGYVEAAPAGGSIWDGPAAEAVTAEAVTADIPARGGQVVLRGHEFHYSEIISDSAASELWRPAYVTRRRDGRQSSEGYCKGRVLASYIHVHFGSCPPAAGRFVELCRETP
jgi:cobyrinic acid a,c-diamide synthase